MWCACPDTAQTKNVTGKLREEWLANHAAAALNDMNTDDMSSRCGNQRRIPALSEEQLMISVIDICTVWGICPSTDKVNQHKHSN